MAEGWFPKRRLQIRSPTEVESQAIDQIHGHGSVAQVRQMSRKAGQLQDH